MLNLILSEKIFTTRSKESLQVLTSKLRERVSGLEVEFKLLSLTPSGWPRVCISGPDEEVYAQILKRDIGLAATKTASLEQNVIMKAFVDETAFGDDAITLDIGLDQSESIQVEYSALAFRAQLFDGEKIPLRTMLAAYCLHPGFPLEVRIPNPFADQGRIAVVLSDSQVKTLAEWRGEPFERIIIQGAFVHEVQETIRTLGVIRDLAHVRELSLMISLLTCKLGTEARGLIPKLGPRLRHARFCVCLPEPHISSTI